MGPPRTDEARGVEGTGVPTRVVEVLLLVPPIDGVRGVLRLSLDLLALLEDDTLCINEGRRGVLMLAEEVDRARDDEGLARIPFMLTDKFTGDMGGGEEASTDFPETEPLSALSFFDSWGSSNHCKCKITDLVAHYNQK